VKVNFEQQIEQVAAADMAEECRHAGEHHLLSIISVVNLHNI
jgi:hypothetical protein